MDTPSRILHLVAPQCEGSKDLLANAEFQAIQKHVQSPDLQRQYQDIAYADFWKKANGEKPYLLHIVTHGSNGQLLTADAFLKELSIDAHSFANDVKNHLGSQLQYIYLGVCDSVALAKALAAEGYTVIAFEGKVDPANGVSFADDFYKFFLRENMDFYEAYTAAKNSWKAIDHHKEGVLPRFYCAATGKDLQFIWDAAAYKSLLYKLHQKKLLGTLFNELGLDTHILKPLNLPDVYRYLMEEKQLFSMRDCIEAHFLKNRHRHTEAFMDFEEGLLKRYVALAPPNETEKYVAISAESLIYRKRLLFGKETLTEEGRSELAKQLSWTLGLDFEPTQAHLLHKTPVLRVQVSPDQERGKRMNPTEFMPWLTEHKKKFFVLQGATGAGKTTFFTDVVAAHFDHRTSQKVFIARFHGKDRLEAQLTAWEKEALGNILILDGLDELHDDGMAILDLLTAKNHPVRAFSKVLLGIRDTFLKANQRLQDAINREDWTILRMAPLQFTAVEDYLRKCFPLNEQERYGAARHRVKRGNSIPPELHEWVTPFELYHIQFLLEEPTTDGLLSDWDIMDWRVQKILEKGSPLDGRKNPIYKQEILTFFTDRVLAAYKEWEKNHNKSLGERLRFTQQDLEDLHINERILRNFSFLSRIENGITAYFTFSHGHFYDYFLARLLFDGKLSEVEFDKSQYPDAYRLYQDYCWKRINPNEKNYNYGWHPVLASALPSFALQVMVRKHGGELPIKHPSVTKYFREVFKNWNPETWNTAMQLAVTQTDGYDISGHLDAIRQQSLIQPVVTELKQVVNFTTHDFQHPLYRDVFAFLHYQQQGKAAAGDFLDKSPFGWLFRHERNWLEYGEQTDAFSLVYPVKDNGSAYGILQKAIEVDAFTDFDQEVYAALHTPAMLQRYYEAAIRLHVQVHAGTLPARLLESIPFPEQVEELSIGGDAALVGDWNLSNFGNLEILDLTILDIQQLHITQCPPMLDTIIHPQADLLPINEGDRTESIRRITIFPGEEHWMQQVPLTPIAPEMVKVEGGTFGMGKGWFEAVQAWSKEYKKKELSDEDSPSFPSYEATVDTFYMAKFPVTVGEFARFVRATSYRTRAERYGFAFGGHVYSDKDEKGKDRPIYADYLLPGLHWRHSVWGDVLLNEDLADLPVVYISYEDAIAYAEWLTGTIGNGGIFRLPTEAEWEFAAKGGLLSKGFMYAGSDNIDEVAQYLHKEPTSLRKTGAAHLADMDAPNELGLYDISGNVYEWCSDWYEQEYYAVCKAEEPVYYPTGPETGSSRVIRGGSWSSTPAMSRSAYRLAGSETSTDMRVGFRVARDL